MHNTKNIEELKIRANEVREVLNSSEKQIKYRGDLVSMVNIVEEIQWKATEFVRLAPNASEEQQEDVEHIARSVVKSCSRILEHEQAWQNGGMMETIELAGNVLKYVQYVGVTFGCTEMGVNSSGKLNMVIHDQDKSNIFMSAFNMDQEQPINFAFNKMNFSLTNHIDNGAVVNPSMCNYKIGVGAVYEKLAKYLSVNISDHLINSEIVAFNYNNKSSTYQLPNDTLAEMM